MSKADSNSLGFSEIVIENQKVKIWESEMLTAVTQRECQVNARIKVEKVSPESYMLSK